MNNLITWGPNYGEPADLPLHLAFLPLGPWVLQWKILGGPNRIANNMLFFLVLVHCLISPNWYSWLSLLSRNSGSSPQFLSMPHPKLATQQLRSQKGSLGFQPGEWFSRQHQGMIQYGPTEFYRIGAQHNTFNYIVSLVFTGAFFSLEWWRASNDGMMHSR